METSIPLSYYWSAIKRRFVLIVAVALVVGLVAYGVAGRSQPHYEVHFSYIVSLSQRERTSDFRFDGYYALQATDLFTSTLAGWITAPEIGISAYEEAGIVSPTDPRVVAKTIRAEKTAPQLVQVTVQSSSETEAQALAGGLKTVIAQNVEKYHDEGIPEVVFRVVATDPWTGAVKPIALLIGVATAVFVFVVGINIVVFLAAVREEA